MLLKKFADALFIEIKVNIIEKNTAFDLIYLTDIQLNKAAVFGEKFTLMNIMINTRNK